MVQAVTHFKDAKKLAEISEGLGDAMKGISNFKDAQFEMLSLKEKN